MSLNFLSTRFRCSWPWEMLVLLCDGRIVCGCADPYANRVLGDTRTASVQDIWAGPTIVRLRDELNNGGSTFCGDCALKLPLKKGEAPPVRPLDAGRLPGRMFIECTAACNISCSQAICAPETGITRTRQAGMLDFDLFRRVVDEVGPTLGRIDFFNYGEAFLHKRAVEMCEYIKSRYPHIYVYTSTNGTAFAEEQARRLVHSGIDEVTFSIDGARADSYVQYRQRGKFDVAIRNLRAMADEKRRSGRDLPCLNWRYILFKWNDSDEEMAEARQMATDIGIDRLCWELTDHPEDSFSRRFVAGSPELESIRRETWDDSNLGNAIPGATPRARIDVRSPLPGVPQIPLLARSGRSLRVRTRVHNLSTRPFPADATYGRRLVRLGAQLCAHDGSLIDLDFARARLPGPLAPGAAADIAIEIPPLDKAGRYTLKFDLVSEGVEWFEKCGSPTTLKPLWGPMTASRAVNIADLRQLAKRRLPRAVFDYIDGGADSEVTLGENCRAFDRVAWRPRSAVATPSCDLRTTVLGTPIAFPLLLAPIGSSRMFYPRGEEVAARAAGAAGIPYILSTLSGCRLEDVKAATTGPAWYQLYLLGGRDVAHAAIERARAAGFSALVVTIDTPVAGLRERDVRNGIKELLGDSTWSKLPFVWQFVAKPRWLIDFLGDGGLMKFPNVVLPHQGPMPYADVGAALEQSMVSWPDLRWIRDAWNGPVVVKGVHTADDARQAIDVGAQAIVVSNHGGRQLDGVAATLRVLPEVVAAANGRVEVLLDGGIRRGGDIAKAVCLGASAVLAGRAYAYGLGAGGGDGVTRAIDILRTDLIRTMKLLGCASVAQLDRECVGIPEGWLADNRRV